MELTEYPRGIDIRPNFITNDDELSILPFLTENITYNNSFPQYINNIIDNIVQTIPDTVIPDIVSVEKYSVGDTYNVLADRNKYVYKWLLIIGSNAKIMFTDNDYSFKTKITSRTLLLLSSDIVDKYSYYITSKNPMFIFTFKKLNELYIINYSVKPPTSVFSMDDVERELIATTISNCSTVLNRPLDKQFSVSPISWIPINQAEFSTWITDTFGDKYPSIAAASSCDKVEIGDLFAHQKFVKDYLQLNSPYKSLLLYHGLGSGKTRASIAIAEGNKTGMKVIVMLPASLHMNYENELKRYGDIMYKTNNHWCFINVVQDSIEENLLISKGIPCNFIRNKYKSNVLGGKTRIGAWLVDTTGDKNYDTLSDTDKREVDAQIDYLINNKYSFVHYNAPNAIAQVLQTCISKSRLKSKEDINTTISLIKSGDLPNPFSNKIVVIDEIHNLISMMAGSGSKGGKIYDLLMNATNLKLVLLSGTPLINYPYEAALLFNILRGYITTIKFTVITERTKEWNEAELTTILNNVGNIEYLNINTRQRIIEITKTPDRFTSSKDNTGITISDKIVNIDEFISNIKKALVERQYLTTFVEVNKHTLFPLEEEFNATFIDIQTNTVKNPDLFRRRIVGLVSYFKGMGGDLFPSVNYNPFAQEFKPFATNSDGSRRPLSAADIIPITVDMSDHQFDKYEFAREIEVNLDKSSKSSKSSKSNKFKQEDINKQILQKTSSLYRVYSRELCNFVFPPDIERPLPGAQDVKVEFDDSDDNNEDESITTSYTDRLLHVLNLLDTDKNRYLTVNSDPFSLATLSPKFVEILKNIQSSIGLVFVYSQFRTLEGVGVFSLVLKANGYTEFKVTRNEAGALIRDYNIHDYYTVLNNIDKFVIGTNCQALVDDIWVNSVIHDINLDTYNITINNKITSVLSSNIRIQKPAFVIYSGTETREIKEYILSIYNSDDNMYGNIIKILMATAAGAEGISLANVRQVHIMEPYWNLVRLNQVIGRAARICSHIKLPPDQRNVSVYTYVSKLTPKQIDKSALVKTTDNKLTSDQILFQIGIRKFKLMNDICKLIKESAVDCMLNKTTNTIDEDITCFKTTKAVGESIYTYQPSIHSDGADKPIVTRVVAKKWPVKSVAINGIKYILREKVEHEKIDYKTTVRLIYDYESYKKGDTVLVGIYNGKLILKPPDENIDDYTRRVEKMV